MNVIHAAVATPRPANHQLGVELLWKLCDRLTMESDWTRIAVDTLRSDDGLVQLRHHYTAGEWELTRIAHGDGEQPVTVWFTTTYPESMPTADYLAAFAHDGSTEFVSRSGGTTALAVRP